MVQCISDFILVPLVETEIYLEFSYGYFVTAKQAGIVQIKMCDNNGTPFISVLYNVLLALYLCDKLLFIITLMN